MSVRVMVTFKVMMMKVMGCMVRKKRGGIVKSCPASFAGQLHCSNTFAGQVSPNPARMTSTSRGALPVNTQHKITLLFLHRNVYSGEGTSSISFGAIYTFMERLGQRGASSFVRAASCKCKPFLQPMHCNVQPMCNQCASNV